MSEKFTDGVRGREFVFNRIKKLTGLRFSQQTSIKFQEIVCFLFFVFCFLFFVFCFFVFLFFCFFVFLFFVFCFFWFFLLTKAAHHYTI